MNFLYTTLNIKEIYLAILILTSFAPFAQVGIGTVSPNPSSVLDIGSSNKGILIPRMTSVEREAIATPVSGLLVYQTNPPTGFYYFNSNWIRLANMVDLAQFTPIYGFAANTMGSTITVMLGGVDIPFPNAQLLSSDIFVNMANNAFTIAKAGRYMITYRINTSANTSASSRLVLNGATVQGSVISPTVSTSNFNSTTIVDIASGGILSVQLYAIVSSVTLTGHANISIVKVQ